MSVLEERYLHFRMSANRTNLYPMRQYTILLTSSYGIEIDTSLEQHQIVFLEFFQLLRVLTHYSKVLNLELKLSS